MESGPSLPRPTPAEEPGPVAIEAKGVCLGPDPVLPLPFALSLALVLATTGISCFDCRTTNSSRRALVAGGAWVLV